MSTALFNIEKRILAAFKLFFNKDYAPSQSNTDEHIIVQKMCYFLSRIDCDITDSGFVWNTFGPFSVDIQRVLKLIDQKPDVLQTFYQKYDPSSILDDDVIDGISQLKTELKIDEHKEHLREWVELLGSLAFIAHSELPTSTFEYINLTLKERKPFFSSDEENKKAWTQLIKMNIAY